MPINAQDKEADEQGRLWLPVVSHQEGISENSKLIVDLQSSSVELVEGSSDEVIYKLSRTGSNESVTFPLLFNHEATNHLAIASQDYIEATPYPRTDYFFPNNVYFCNVSSPLNAENAGPEALGLAELNDFALHDEIGNKLTDSITFEEGELEKRIIFTAIDDTKIEVPEKLEIFIQPIKGYTVHNANLIDIKIVEGLNKVTDNSQLFVGEMLAESNVQTSANGLITLRLAEDNSYALVSMSFEGLTSQQTAAHIHIANPESGPIIYSLPLGQFADQHWGVKAAQIVQTDQNMLDRLYAGDLYANIHSAEYPAGEIRGTLYQANGKTNPIYNYPMPQYETLTGDDLSRDVVRFLRQSTFGPTSESVAELEQRIALKNGDRIAAYSEWIDEQMLLESPSHQSFYVSGRNLYLSIIPPDELEEAKLGIPSRFWPFLGGWFSQSAHSEAQLRERVGFALSEIFVASVRNGQVGVRLEGMTHYNDMLKQNAFGDFETLLTDISKHPIMGYYLSHLQNKQNQFNENGILIASPDENYAREVMQLFSIGLIELHPDYLIKLDASGLPIQTYSQTDITELARVFTGWSFSMRSPSNGDTPTAIPNTEFAYGGQPLTELFHPYLTHPMSSFDDNGYDPSHPKFEAVRDQGQKVILGEVFPAGQSGEDDLAQIMGILSNHPNTAPFISYRLIQRLVTSNPSAGYIYRVSTTFTNSGGDLGETVKAILLDPEARNLESAQSPSFGRIHEPLVRSMNLYRLMDVEYVGESRVTIDTLTSYGLPFTELDLYDKNTSIVSLEFDILTGPTSFQQAPLAAPSVFNWFSPTFAPSGPIAESGLVAPELSHMNASLAVNFYNHVYDITSDPSNNRLSKTDLPQAYDAYMAEMDTNKDGTISELDSTFYDPNAIRQATAAMIDVYDLYVCDGWLKARATGDPFTDAREIIIDGISAIHQSDDGTTEEAALLARDNRLREAVNIVFAAPQCMVQK